jgi:hypothetical protein
MLVGEKGGMEKLCNVPKIAQLGRSEQEEQVLLRPWVLAKEQKPWCILGL